MIITSGKVQRMKIYNEVQSTKFVHVQFFEILSCLTLSSPAADGFGGAVRLSLQFDDQCQQLWLVAAMSTDNKDENLVYKLKLTAGFVIPTLLLLLHTSVASCLFDPWTMASSPSSSSASTASSIPPWRLLREEEVSGARLMPPPPQSGRLQSGKVQSEEKVENEKSQSAPDRSSEFGTVPVPSEARVI